MQRVKIPGGILTHEQWRALADLCRRYTPSAPLLITTRQDIEFHNLTTETIPLLQAELADAGLTSVGACGGYAAKHHHLSRERAIQRYP